MKLKFAAMNIKNLAIRRWRDKSVSHALLSLCLENVKNPVSASGADRVLRQADNYTYSLINAFNVQMD